MPSRPASLAIVPVGRVTGRLNALRERFKRSAPASVRSWFRSRPVASTSKLPDDIGIANSTVKVHRTNLMRKMKARSLPELSRMADILKLAPEKPPH